MSEIVTMHDFEIMQACDQNTVNTDMSKLFAILGSWHLKRVIVAFPKFRLTTEYSASRGVISSKELESGPARRRD